jgi:AcrR family transcriptional regulator
MTDTESKLRQRSVGRLDRSRDPAILNAAVAALTEHGYHATNMNDIAARAGVGKAAIYRRWSSKAALITDALVYWRPDLMSDDIPDTGSLTGDFDALVEHAARNDDNLISHDLVLRVALEAAHDPELASALHDLMLHKGRREISAILERAAARGEISGDRDWSLVADALTAMGLMQVISGQTVDAKFVRAVIDTLVLPAVPSPVSAWVGEGSTLRATATIDRLATSTIAIAVRVTDDSERLIAVGNVGCTVTYRKPVTDQVSECDSSDETATFLMDKPLLYKRLHELQGAVA